MGKFKNKKQERYISAPLKLVESPAYKALCWSARSLFWDLRSKFNGFNNGNIGASLTSLRSAGWTSSATLTKCLRELESVGLIEKTRKTVGVEKGSKMCNLYRFTDLPVNEFSKFGISAMRETNEFLFIKTAKEAKERVEGSSAKKSTLHSLNHDASKSKASVVTINSEVEKVIFASTSNGESRKNHQIQREAFKGNGLH